MFRECVFMAQQTTRQKQSRKIRKDREKQLKLKVIRRWAVVAGLTLVLGLVASGGLWIKHNNIVEKTTLAASQMFLDATRAGGLRVKNIYIEGREKTPQSAVLSSLGVGLGGALLQISLEDARTQLEAISTVRRASVERIFPDTLKVKIQERQPIAIWQSKQKLMLVDDEGKVLEGEDAKAYPHLMVVVGNGAPVKAKDLIALLAKEPELDKQVTAAVRVGERRWNLKFKGGVNVLLPEEGEEAALHKLAKMQQEQSIFQKSITAIDMRLQERIFIKLTPESIQRRAPESHKPQGPRTET
jgi:cell division protein FtsQ